MKRKLFIIAIISLLLLSLTGCGDPKIETFDTGVAEFRTNVQKELANANYDITLPEYGETKTEKDGVTYKTYKFYITGTLVITIGESETYGEYVQVYLDKILITPETEQTAYLDYNAVVRSVIRTVDASVDPTELFAILDQNIDKTQTTQPIDHHHFTYIYMDSDTTRNLLIYDRN